MNKEQQHEQSGCTDYLQHNADSCPHMNTELFNADETPFNLAGGLLDNSLTPEGEARKRAQAEAEAKKAQTTLKWDDPVYWKGVRIGQCVSCHRNGKDVLRNGLCWLCDTQKR